MSEEGNEKGSAGSRKKLSADEAEVLVENIVAEAMKKMGYQLGPDGKPDFSQVPEGDLAGKIPAMVLEMFQTAMARERERTGSSGVSVTVPEEDAPAPETRKPPENREPTEFERQIQSNLRQAMEDYLVQNVVEPNQKEDVQIDVDARFLKEHGGPILTTLVGAFAKSLLPEEISVEVPVTEEDEGGEKKKVKMALDFGKLLKGIVERGGKSATEDEGEGD